MPKGLIRSLSRGEPTLAPVIKTRVEVDVELIPGDGSARFATAVIAGFPEGYVLVHGAVAQLTFNGAAAANLVAAWAGDFSVGLQGASSAALSGAVVNVIPATEIPAATNKVASAVGTSASQALFDATSGDTTISISMLVDDANISGGAPIQVTGSLDFVVSVLGDD